MRQKICRSNFIPFKPSHIFHQGSDAICCSVWILQDVILKSCSAEMLQTCIRGFLLGFIVVIFFAFLAFSLSGPGTPVITFVCVKAHAGNVFVTILTSLRFQFVKACRTSGNDSSWSDMNNHAPHLSANRQTAKGNSSEDKLFAQSVLSLSGNFE